MPLEEERLVSSNVSLVPAAVMHLAAIIMVSVFALLAGATKPAWV